VAPSLEQATQEVEAARRACAHLTQAREQVSQRLCAIGHASHFVDLERGIRRHGQLMAGALQGQIETLRPMAHHEGLSRACLERIEQAERGVPKMQATSAFVSGYVCQQVRQLHVAPPVS
jgi:hypothetical protein